MRDAAIWCEASGRSDEADAIHDVLRFRLDAAAAAYRVPIDLENIEELFSLASAADQKITRSVKRSIAATLAFSAANSPEPYLTFGIHDSTATDFRKVSKVNGSDLSSHRINLYDALAIRALRCGSPAQSSIITFNYDGLVERSIKNIGGRYHHGFRDGFEVEGGVPYDNNGVAVLKLHGRTNWAYHKPKKFTVFSDYESVRGSGLLPEIVPPWNKAIAKRLGEVWSAAIDRLSTATKIVVIGFSLPETDMHFKYLLAAGMQRNFSLRRVTFVDPSRSIPDRVSRVLAQREIAMNRVVFASKKAEDLVGRSGEYGYTGSAVVAL
jgi:hypothetical protein